MYNYNSIIIVITLAIVISAILVIGSYILSIQNSDVEKLSSYECGFNPYSDARQKFQVQFFLVGILFIIFDLEISFLFPGTVVLNLIPTIGYGTMIVFLFILTIGLVYEGKKGGLDGH